MNIGFYGDGYFSLHRYLCSVMIHPVCFANTMNTSKLIFRIAKHSPLANHQVCSVHFILCQYLYLSRAYSRIVVAMLHPS